MFRTNDDDQLTFNNLNVMTFIPGIGQHLNSYQSICCPNFPNTVQVLDNQVDLELFSTEYSIDRERIQGTDKRRSMIEMQPDLLQKSRHLNYSHVVN